MATHLMRPGVSARAIQELLGHRSLEATSRYLVAHPEELRSTVALLELGEASPPP